MKTFVNFSTGALAQIWRLVGPSLITAGGAYLGQTPYGAAIGFGLKAVKAGLATHYEAEQKPVPTWLSALPF